jgi:hypothetical protein
MAFVAVLDASVLYPLPLRDTLLRVAETELYDSYWSERILDEVIRNLVADGRATEEQARRHGGGNERGIRRRRRPAGRRRPPRTSDDQPRQKTATSSPPPWPATPSPS